MTPKTELRRLRERVIAALVLAALSLVGCSSPRMPHATAVPMGAHFYRIDGQNWEESWMRLRYLMGEQKAGGVRVWSDSDESNGTNHMLVDLIIYE